MADENGQSDGSRGAPAETSQQFDVHPEQPLKRFDSPPALAFAASEKRNPSRELFALVCDPKQPPRHDQVNIMRRIQQKGMIRILVWSVRD